MIQGSSEGLMRPLWGEEGGGGRVGDHVTSY